MMRRGTSQMQYSNSANGKSSFRGGWLLGVSTVFEGISVDQRWKFSNIQHIKDIQIRQVRVWGNNPSENGPRTFTITAVDVF